VKTSGFLHPCIYTGIPLGFPGDRFLAFDGEGMTWMMQPSWQESHYFQCAWNFGEAQVVVAKPAANNAAAGIDAIATKNI
jgi:hypothetical protein